MKTGLPTVGAGGGVRYEYHFASLPRRTFEALLNRVLRPDVDAAMRRGGPDQLPAIPDPPLVISGAGAAAPA